MMKCPFCDKMLRKYPKEGRKRSKKLSVAVRSHLLCFHPDERNNPQFLEIMEQYEKKEFICTECGKCLYSNQSLEQHMVQSHATHLNTIPCHLCGKFLKTNYLLQAHIKNIHERNISKNALCGDCGKTFTTKSILRRHIDRMHSDQIFKCNECGKEFRSKDALMKHVRIYHNGREPVKCPQCDKSFQEDRNLQKHIRQVSVVHLDVEDFSEELLRCLLCHKEPAPRIQSPLLGTLERKKPPTRGFLLAPRWFFMA